MWSGWLSFITFFRYIAKLTINYDKWNHCERLGELTGFRWMHKEFCIIAERPIKFSVDEDNQGHCEDGPYCQWADGSGLYMIHGHSVPRWIVENPELITLAKIEAENDAEIRRIMTERYGLEKYLVESGAELVDTDTPKVKGASPRALVKTTKGEYLLIVGDGSTSRIYSLRSHETKTCKEAHELIMGMDESTIIAEA